MNIYAPTFWPNGSEIDHGAPSLRLGDILPALGSITFACFDKHHLPHTGETVLLLWIPPVADINGWSEQPSEIALSYLLTAKVISEATLISPSERDPNFILRGKYRYTINILARERLLDVLKNFTVDADSWSLPTVGTDQGTTQLWGEVHWCGMASVEGLIYLVANTRNEGFMELLLSKEGEHLIGLFSLELNPSGIQCNLGKHRLTDMEQHSIQRAMRKAQPLLDSQAPYIVLCGALD